MNNRKKIRVRIFERKSVKIFGSNFCQKFSFKYSYAGPYKKSVKRGFSDGTVIQGESNESFITLMCIFFLGKFRSNILRGFFFKYFLADFLHNILSRFFYRIFFCGLKNCFTGFISTMLPRIFLRIFFTDFLLNIIIYDHIKICLTVVLSDGTDT